jgi:hypothetical protein
MSSSPPAYICHVYYRDMLHLHARQFTQDYTANANNNQQFQARRKIVIFFPLEMQVIKRWVLDMQCHNLAVE